MPQSSLSLIGWLRKDGKLKSDGKVILKVFELVKDDWLYGEICVTEVGIDAVCGLSLAELEGIYLCGAA